MSEIVLIAVFIIAIVLVALLLLAIGSSLRAQMNDITYKNKD